MKFEELVFNPHPAVKEMVTSDGSFPDIFKEWEGSKQAFYEELGMGFSIIFGKMFYSDGETTYEVMCIEGCPDIEDKQPRH